METKEDMAAAYGIVGIFDYALTPHVSIGVAPRLVLHVIGKPDQEQDTPDKEIDLRARLRVRYPVIAGLQLYASFSPGYAIVTSDSDAVDSPTGFAIGGAAGLTYDISSNLFLGAEVGYQRAFTSTHVMIAGQSIETNLDLSYLHIGMGAGMQF